VREEDSRLALLGGAALDPAAALRLATGAARTRLVAPNPAHR
jgi:hypothetical protein